MAELNQDWTAATANERRVEELVQRLTLEQKIDLVSGKLAVDDAGQLPVLPDGIPLLALADGPGGIRVANPTLSDHCATSLPAPIALAATWDPDLARRYGHVLGAEAAASGHNILLAPAVDIARAPLGGRTFESFGEDPFLQAQMVAPEIEAIQSHHVAACIKHYILNNQEYQRNGIDVRVDERALQEIYLPPFAAAVRQGRVAAVMGSYNRIDGVYACENRHTLTEILRQQLGFCGFVMSDFLGNQSTAASANAGLDWELGAKMWGAKLQQAVEAGDVPLATLDEQVRRILRPILGLGLAEHPLHPRPLPIEEHGAIARAIAEQAIVLLKNETGLLPLDGGALHSLALIGPEVDSVSAAGGGSGCVQPTYAVSVLDGIRQRAGEQVIVEVAPGVDPIGAGVLLPGLPAIPSAFFTPPDTQKRHGLLAEYWANTDFAGEPHTGRTEPRPECNYGFFDFLPGLGVSCPRLPPKPAGLHGRISVRWTGNLFAPASGDYTLGLTCLGTAQLYLDGSLIIDTAASPRPVQQTNTDAPRFGNAPASMTTASTTLRLAGGERHAIRIDYAADAPGQWIFGEAMLRLGWRPPAGVVNPLITEAANLARRSDVAVVVVRTYETEEMDRPHLRLPNEQDQLIRAVAAANPRTVVVLMNAGPVAVADWQVDVPAIVEAWYGGQEQGNAVARVIFGDVNPGGRLPLTFPRSETQTPVAAPAQYPGVDGVVHYSEGLYVGYRGYEEFGFEPQYPFGHGLSYTDFDYTHLQLSSDQLGPDDVLTVAVDVTNTGSRPGDEVVQMYVKHLDSAVARPPQALKGFRRLHLQPGETRTVLLGLAAADLAYWDATSGRFVVEGGKVQIRVGRSSSDLRLAATIEVKS